MSSSLVVGYARVSRSGTDGSDQRTALLARGVTPDRVYIDIGLTGMSRPRPALGEAMAACREGDTLVVTRLARLARSVRDAHELIGRLSAEHVTLAVGDERFVLAESGGQILLQVLALSWDLQVAVGSGRTREGLGVARPRGQLRGRPPTLNRRQDNHLVGLYLKGDRTVKEVGELLNVSRSTVYRAARRAEDRAESATPPDEVSVPTSTWRGGPRW